MAFLGVVRANQAQRASDTFAPKNRPPHGVSALFIIRYAPAELTSFARGLHDPRRTSLMHGETERGTKCVGLVTNIAGCLGRPKPSIKWWLILRSEVSSKFRAVRCSGRRSPCGTGTRGSACHSEGVPLPQGYRSRGRQQGPRRS